MLEHGGALRAAAARYGIPLNDWLDLSTGIHPQGWPVPSVPAIAWQRLPEREDGLEAAAAAYYGTSHLLPVAGSQAAIQALPLLRKPGRMGVLHPSYAEHAHAWQRAGHVVETLTVMELETAVDRLDVLVLVHPNNPTGLRFAPEILLR
ncbi:MAG: threonine-phosphate decarboxylase, partial [Candidatus Competibacteraceae bacterium]|nr:threonine-phosphate decarboxylase [Candidatus Competibacteraceae bacterium]